MPGCQALLFCPVGTEGVERKWLLQIGASGKMSGKTKTDGFTLYDDKGLTAYISAMAMADRLLSEALITEREFYAFEKKIREKNGVPEASIFLDYRLLYTPIQR